MQSAHRLMILYIHAKAFKNVANHSRGIERTLKTVIQCFTLNYDLDLNIHTCTLNHHTWHLCRVICKSYKGFKRYTADTIVCLTLNYDLGLKVTLVKHVLCTLSHFTVHFKMSLTHQELKKRKRKKSYKVKTWTMTLTLIKSWSNICTAHWLTIFYICAEYNVNPTRDSKDKERTKKWNYPWTLTLTLNRHW